MRTVHPVIALLLLVLPVAALQGPRPVVGDADAIGLPIDCASSLRDQALPASCIGASSVPQAGLLYPLGPAFFVDPLGRVGLGTMTPAENLEVAGTVLSRDSVLASFGGASTPTYRFGAGLEGTGLSSPEFEQLSLITSNQERVRVTDDGHVNVGSTPPVSQLYVGRLQVNGTLMNSEAAIASYGSYVGVFGQADGPGTTVLPAGVYGRTTNPAGYGVYSTGNFGASGLKLFLQPHPTDASRQIRFVSLEGNESGTYFRGRAQLARGRAEVAVPEEFRLVTEPDSTTVQLTPVGGYSRLWVESHDLDRIVVRGEPDVEFHYFVNGVRRGFADLDLVQSNTSFVPTLRGVPFGAEYPEAVRRILVENGTLNADFTPNEETARRNGWELRDPAPVGEAPARAPRR